MHRCLLLLPLVLVAACSGSAASPSDLAMSDGSSAPSALGMPGTMTHTMAGYPTRVYDVRIPPAYDGTTPLPVLLNLHGGGGNRSAARKTTCPGGDLSSPGCLEPVADAHGFIVVTPDGTGAPVAGELRTWNAGGGTDGWQCVSAYACNQKVDEAAYFTALLADLESYVHYDAKRVYATGFSNGAAMVQRLACELPDLIAGIAPVSGGNQYATGMPCTAQKAVVEIHGTADPCWPYAGGAQSCADNNPGSKVSIPDTLQGWLTRNACGTTPTDMPLADLVSDGTTTIAHRYSCSAGHPVAFYEVTGGGHHWPSGYDSGGNGPQSNDFSANEVIFDFFAALK